MKGTKSQAGSHGTDKDVSEPAQESPSFHGKIILINSSSHQEGLRIPHGDKSTFFLTGLSEAVILKMHL